MAGQCLDKLPHCKEIDGLPNHYVHSDGTIYKITEVSQYKNAAGYMYIKPMIKGDYIFKYVHRAVAEMFVPNPTNRRVVHHKNNNKITNNKENLQWVTHKENCQLPSRISTCVTHKIYGDDVVKNIREFARKWGIDSSALSKMLKGKFKQTSGWSIKNGR